MYVSFSSYSVAMRALVLSILVIVLIAIGLVMSKKVKETFEDMQTPSTPPSQAPYPNALPQAPNASIAIPAVVTMTPQVDTIQRGLQEQAPDMPTAGAVSETRRPLGPGGEQRCPPCKQCPDMSKYIRMDEIPCWNCTLP
jgi:Na+-transporting methylmalonyl-CoA/oxaloacetate decarboxylase gamma subunit